MTTIDFSDQNNQLRLKELLVGQTLCVSFTKANGEQRDMRCTLSTRVIPPSDPKSSTRSVSPEVIRVWDTEKEGWRSFRFDSIRSVTPWTEETYF